MNEEILIAGFGGQGVLSMGKILAHSGMLEGLEVSWIPSYGPEMRGGTANVTVILSSQRISSPVLTEYDIAILLNQQSLDKFEKTIKPGGILLYDNHGISNPPSRKDIKIYYLDAMNEAQKMGSSKTVNMLVLGALLKIKSIVKTDTVIESLKKSLPARHHHLLPLNQKSIMHGMDVVQSAN